jgi:hypothetical protein
LPPPGWEAALARLAGSTGRHLQVVRFRCSRRVAPVMPAFRRVVPLARACTKMRACAKVGRKRKTAETNAPRCGRGQLSVAV